MLEFPKLLDFPVYGVDGTELGLWWFNYSLLNYLSEPVEPENCMGLVMGGAAHGKTAVTKEKAAEKESIAKQILLLQQYSIGIDSYSERVAKVRKKRGVKLNQPLDAEGRAEVAQEAEKDFFTFISQPNLIWNFLDTQLVAEPYDRGFGPDRGISVVKKLAAHHNLINRGIDLDGYRISDAEWIKVQQQYPARFKIKFEYLAAEKAVIEKAIRIRSQVHELAAGNQDWGKIPALLEKEGLVAPKDVPLDTLAYKILISGHPDIIRNIEQQVRREIKGRYKGTEFFTKMFKNLKKSPLAPRLRSELREKIAYLQTILYHELKLSKEDAQVAINFINNKSNKRFHP